MEKNEESKLQQGDEKESSESPEGFVPFAKIPNSHHTDPVLNLQKAVPDDALWIAVEKVHGANFSFLQHANGTVEWCKRTGNIKENDGFYSRHKEVIEEHEKPLTALASDLAKGDKVQVQVYGELYGGLWDGEKNGMIQKEVVYSPDVHFIVFSVQVDGLDVSYAEVIDLCKKHNIPHLPILKQGNLSELLSLSPLFHSTIPALHGLEVKEDNYAEGYMLSTIEPFFNSSTGKNMRGFIKHKSPHFTERDMSTKVKVKSASVQPKQPKKKGGKKAGYTPPKLSPFKARMVERACEYVCDIRLSSVLSKTGTDNGVPSQAVGLLCNDAWDDFIIELPEEDGILWTEKFGSAKQLRKLVTGPMRRKAMEIVKARIEENT